MLMSLGTWPKLNLVCFNWWQMEDEFNMGVKELARNLRVGLMQFM